MFVDASGLGPLPPLRFAWRSEVALATVVPGSSSIYGITTDGKVVSLNPANGRLRWKSVNSYLTRRLTVSGSKLFAFRQDVGLTAITDLGTTFEEKTLASISPLKADAQVSPIVVDDSNGLVYFIKDQALVSITQTGSIIGGTDAGPEVPHTVLPVGDGVLVTVDGYGFPSRWEFRDKKFTRKWQKVLPGLGPERAEQLAHLSGNLVYCSQHKGVACVRLDTGAVVWRDNRITARFITSGEDSVYVAGEYAQIHALDAQTGALRWERAYLYDSTAIARVGAAFSGSVLYVGVTLNAGDPHLYALSSTDGSMMWQANSARLAFGAGLPSVTADTVLTYGSSAPATAMTALPAAPVVTGEHVRWAPNPLRGGVADFSGALEIQLDRKATISAAAWRETAGRGQVFVDQRSLGAGTHRFDWMAGATGGFTAQGQFGRIAVDVVEDGGPSYTCAVLVPVNTLPDVLSHWGRQSIETMLYHKFIGGYPDLTFRPNNLVTRAESSSIIAKTLGLESPSPGFQTKFTDIANHWAKNSVMALEEKGIIGGFQEADGTFTFRPNLNMTRAQEARILVKAYSIPAAPPGFTSKFSDITEHWAALDIKALEAAGYVNGFQESDGSFTYRPEQNLTRAELSTVVVRIRKLTRP